MLSVMIVRDGMLVKTQDMGVGLGLRYVAEPYEPLGNPPCYVCLFFLSDTSAQWCEDMRCVTLETAIAGVGKIGAHFLQHLLQRSHFTSRWVLKHHDSKTT